MGSTQSSLSRVDRRLVIGVFLITACWAGMFASFFFVITPMAAAVEATRSQAVLIRQLPSLGALLVVFLVGLLGSRLGMKRVIVASAVVMTAGNLIVLVASSVPVVTVGLLLGYIGTQGLAVVTLALIGSRLVGDGARATGFAAVGMGRSAGAVAIPILASTVLEATNWRLAVALWVAVSAVAVVVAIKMLPPDGPRSALGELWTPALAGVVLVGIVQWVLLASQQGLFGAGTVVWLAVSAGALAALWLLMQQLPAPTLDVSVFRSKPLLLMLLVLVLLLCPFLTYYLVVGFQRLYGYSATGTALLLVPCQLAGVAGAWIARDWTRRLGLRRAGTWMLAMVSASMFLTAVQQSDTPVIVPVLIGCLYTLAFAGAGVVVTHVIMNLSPEGREGSVAAGRSAAWCVGEAIAITLSAAVFLGIAQSTMQDLVSQSGGNPRVAAMVINRLRDITVRDEAIAAEYGLSVEEVTTYNEQWLDAQLTGYRGQGLVGGCLGLSATALFALNRRGLHRAGDEGGGA